MIDLFGSGTAENRGENRGEPRNLGSAVLGTPIVEPRNRGIRASPLQSAEKRGTSSTIGGPGRAGPPDQETKIRMLLSERQKLHEQLGEIDRYISGLQPSYDVLKAAFEDARGDCAFGVGVTWDNRSDEAKAKRRALYNHRMAAGFAWHPVRKAYRDLESWRKAVVADLRRINTEIQA